jgi:DNA-binding TFAR19-related protein (PDSD5 family)
MTDHELEILRRKKMAKLKRNFGKKIETNTKTQTKNKKVEPQKILKEFLVGRAWEVLNTARIQYPHAAKHIENTLVKLITEGKIKKKISGGELYTLFRRLGYRIKLQTHIRILEHGKAKSLEEKMKEEAIK